MAKQNLQTAAMTHDQLSAISSLVADGKETTVLAGIPELYGHFHHTLLNALPIAGLTA